MLSELHNFARSIKPAFDARLPELEMTLPLVLDTNVKRRG
jgi:hypothetical protein